MPATPTFTSTTEGDRLRLSAAGAWTIDQAELLRTLVAGAPAGAGRAEIDIAGIEKLDTFGAWLIERLIRQWRDKGGEAELTSVPDRYRGLLGEVGEANRRTPSQPVRRSGPLVQVENIGRATARFAAELGELVGLLGMVAVALGRTIVHPRAARLTSIVHHLDRVGWQAIGIILLITFLIGCIISQQGIYNFRRFGAEDYVVDLVGILVLREIGVLLVAIMIAGRSGSSYTAELGSMKMREEIDALRTMGVDPAEVLILPRVVALVIALPILTFLGSMAALTGGGLVTWLYGGMSPLIFLERLRDAVSMDDFQVGMIKAPVMALIIGIVACAEGMRVKGSAESLGLQTTASVVKSIFLVIVLDGLFAMFFASIGM
ncbi:MAG: MlaE family lipid ABC transporter permease subunit [Bauldia sp.]